LGTIRDGYGYISIGTTNHRAHRLLWESIHGPTPEGLVLDHLCRRRDCVRPDHLELVTNHENVLRGVGISAENARKEFCANGHPFDTANTRIELRNDGRRKRRCRACSRDKTARYRASKASCPGCGIELSKRALPDHRRSMHPESQAAALGLDVEAGEPR